MRGVVLIFICVVGVFSNFRTFSQNSLIDLQKIDDYLQSELKTNGIPGFAIAIVNRDKIIFSKGYGKTSAGQAITGETPFAIASLSKAFTALTVMQLVEEGRINLDSSVGYYIPSFPLNRYHITVRQILNQTSGLTDRIFPEMAFSVEPTDLASSISRLEGVTLISKPGEKNQYHNPNYQIAATIVEAVTGEDFSRTLEKKIFYPLGMIHTSNSKLTSEFYSQQSLLNGHVYVFGKAIPIKDPEWFVKGAAGMTSTINDLGAWLIMNINEGIYRGDTILSRESIKVMQSRPFNHTSHYGMGWFINDDENEISHNGTLWTYQAEQVILKKEGLGIVILFNGGLNIFHDPGTLMRGVVGIIKSETPETTPFPVIIYEYVVISLIILSFFLFVRRIKKVNIWIEKYRAKSTVSRLINFVWRLIPLIILIFIPGIITLLSGRVLGWERIFLMMPSVIIWLLVLVILNSIVIGIRLRRILQS